MKSILFLIVIVFACSCGSGFGSKLKSENLEIYFDNKNLEAYADSLGKYWTKNKLTGNRKQFLKITKSSTTFQVKIIQSPEFSQDGLSVNENYLLDSLRSDISKSVFNNEPTLLIICDNQFKPLIHFKP